MSDLIEFLRARLDEDEVEAKRRLIEIHGGGSDPCDTHGPDLRSIPCDTLLLLAVLYADHPDYRPEWKP